MPTVKKFPCAGMTINQIVRAFEDISSVTVQNVSIEGDFASVYFTTTDEWEMELFGAIDEIPLIKDVMHKYNGYSSGEISLETGFNRGAIKRAMQEMEKDGLGAYSMFDGMFYYWSYDINPKE